ncbi:MAG: hypothetical protein ACI845_004148, partial [Gammaproteobacteria bacterium]
NMKEWFHKNQDNAIVNLRLWHYILILKNIPC